MSFGGADTSVGYPRRGIARGKGLEQALGEVVDRGSLGLLRRPGGCPAFPVLMAPVSGLRHGAAVPTAVGLTLQAARDHGVDARAYDVPSSGTAGAAFYGTGTPGTARIVVDEHQGVIVGATFTGTEVAEWLQAATIAVVGEIPLALLREAVPPFPTRSEVWLRLLERWSTRTQSA